MSCDVAAAAFALHLAAFHPAAPPPRPVPAVAAANPLAREPLFSAIVEAAGQLKGEVDGFRRAGALPASALAGVRAQTVSLSALDMQGHLELAKRGTDGDLKCILRGISQDLPRKLDQVVAARDPAGRRSALEEFFYLLRDNVEVVTSPPRDSSTDLAKPS